MQCFVLYALELVRCRLAIRYCIGYFSDGRERHRTFSLPDVRPDTSADALARVVRAVAPLLTHPITKVSIIKKYVMVLDGAGALHAHRTFRNQSAQISSDVPAAFYPERLAASGSRFTPRPDVFVFMMFQGRGYQARGMKSSGTSIFTVSPVCVMTYMPALSAAVLTVLGMMAPARAP